MKEISSYYRALSYDSLALILLQSTGIVPQSSLQRMQIKICITFQSHMTKLSLKSIQKIRISSCASREKSVSTPVHHARNPYQPLCITRAALLCPRGRNRRARTGEVHTFAVARATFIEQIVKAKVKRIVRLSSSHIFV